MNFSTIESTKEKKLQRQVFYLSRGIPRHLRKDSNLIRKKNELSKESTFSQEFKVQKKNKASTQEGIRYKTNVPIAPNSTHN